MVEDTLLTDMLLRMDLEQEIPPELYAVVAEVLIFVSNMDEKCNKRFGIAKSR